VITSGSIIFKPQPHCTNNGDIDSKNFGDGSNGLLLYHGYFAGIFVVPQNVFGMELSFE
jgi:hypothetical protein